MRACRSASALHSLILGSEVIGSQNVGLPGLFGPVASWRLVGGWVLDQGAVVGCAGDVNVIFGSQIERDRKQFC